MGITDFTQIPYLKRGRTKAGCDCYGFVRLVLEDAGYSLPLYDFQGCGGELAAGIEEFELSAVQSPGNYDIVYLVSNKNREHIGVYINGSVWHMTRHGVNSRPWKRIQGQVKGVYRVKG